MYILNNRIQTKNTLDLKKMLLLVYQYKICILLDRRNSLVNFIVF
jgi:hypothetical protein